MRSKARSRKPDNLTDIVRRLCLLLDLLFLLEEVPQHQVKHIASLANILTENPTIDLRFLSRLLLRVGLNPQQYGEAMENEFGCDLVE